jgi:hypothetical protein
MHEESSGVWIMAYTTIDDPSAYFQTLLYTGDGGSNRTINFDGNSDLQPDFLWVKKRSASQNHYLANTNDSISKVMYSNDTGVEANETSQFKSVHSDGWVQGADNTNTNTATFVAWGWKANGGTATATASESGDNPAYSVQANTDAGFSIVTYTGTGADTSTVPHGLGATPKMIIFKRRDSTTNWIVYHNSLTSASNYLNLNLSDAQKSASNIFDDTAPTSSVFTLGFSAAVNADGGTFVAYCFAPIQGYSKFGSYTGNGSTDGAFIYTGFKPAWLMTKNTQSAAHWHIWDNRRTPFNANDENLIANTSQAENSAYAVDFLSNGWKARVNDEVNNSGQSFIYMAFAESPFVSSTGVPATAR